MNQVTPIAAASARVHASNFYGAWRKVADIFSTGAFQKGRRGFVGGLAAAPAIAALPKAEAPVIPYAFGEVDPIARLDVGWIARSEARMQALNAYEFAEFQAAQIRAIVLSLSVPSELLASDYYSTRYAAVREFGFEP